MTRSVTLLLPAVGIAACAWTSATAGRSQCGLTPADSAYLIGGPVYRDCAVEHPAVLVDRTARPELHLSSLPPAGSCYAADVEFVVDTSGTPEAGTVKIVRTNNSDFAAAAVEAMRRWLYRPATLNGTAVRQIVREHLGIALQVIAAPMGQPPQPGRPPTC
jgi:hypothetical protein